VCVTILYFTVYKYKCQLLNTVMYNILRIVILVVSYYVLRCMYCILCYLIIKLTCSIEEPLCGNKSLLLLLFIIIIINIKGITKIALNTNAAYCHHS
jgi:hypothetical protein